MRRRLLVGAAVALGLGSLAVVLTHGAGDRGAAMRRPASTGPDADLATRLRRADVAVGASLFGQCAACHSVGRGGVDLDGPNLYGVVGSRVAWRRARFNYSSALRQAGGVWSFERLDAWLTSPAHFAPGTSMTFAGLPDAQDRADVIAYLNAQGSKLPPP